MNLKDRIVYPKLHHSLVNLGMLILAEWDVLGNWKHFPK
jgi:hypothetical protein